MKISNLFAVASVVATIFGLALVLVTGPMMSLYGVTLNPPGTFLAQLLGAELLGFAALNWFARNVTDSNALRAIVLANFAADTIGFVMSLLAQLGGIVNALGWSTVIIYLLLAAAFGYFQFVKAVAPRQSQPG